MIKDAQWTKLQVLMLVFSIALLISTLILIWLTMESQPQVYSQYLDFVQAAEGAIYA